MVSKLTRFKLVCRHRTGTSVPSAKATGNMRRKYLVFAIVGVGTAIFMAAATFTPTLEYDPRLATAPARIRVESPAQVVEEMLQRSGQLPPPGTGLVRRDGVLAWDVAPGFGVRIANVEVRLVRLVAGTPLLWTALDDDPTYRAKVDVTVTTSDGQKTALSVDLWDYGILTPWSLYPRGDGWKPGGVWWHQNR